MRIVTMGPTPFLLFSKAIVHAGLIDHLISNEAYEIGACVWMHDPNTFPPDENNLFFYHTQNQAVPLFPFVKGKDESVAVYEWFKVLQPDLVITVGDLSDYLFLKAVRMFCSKPFRWMMLCTSGNLPINEHYWEELSEYDAVLCTNQAMATALKERVNCAVEWAPIGSSPTGPAPSNQTDTLKVFSLSRNTQNDNIAGIMESVSLARRDCAIELYLHCNTFDEMGHYNLSILQNRYDPNGHFIFFANEAVSLLDGVSSELLRDRMTAHDVVLGVQGFSGCGIAVYEALACGCWPLLTESLANRDILQQIHEEGVEDSLIPVNSTRFLGRNETYQNICDIDALAARFVKISQNLAFIRGSRTRLIEISKKIPRTNFFLLAGQIIEDVLHKGQKNTITLEL